MDPLRCYDVAHKQLHVAGHHGSRPFPTFVGQVFGYFLRHLPPTLARRRCKRMAISNVCDSHVTCGQCGRVQLPTTYCTDDSIYQSAGVLPASAGAIIPQNSFRLLMQNCRLLQMLIDSRMSCSQAQLQVSVVASSLNPGSALRVVLPFTTTDRCT